MRQLILISLLLCAAIPAGAQVSVSIGINVPVYPQLVRVPGYPVYYAPDEDWNYFFYDGMYWVYQDDYWYSSSWYDGPWYLVEPEFVPVFVLRVPVRYYRRPPVYFLGWHSDRPPRWDDHWGHEWSRRHSGWDRWNRNSAPRSAPLPTYQRQYSGDRYPRAEQQPTLNNQHYRYQPRDPLVRQRVQPQRDQHTPAATARPEARPDRQDRNSTQRVNERNQAPQPNRQYAPEIPHEATPQDDRRNRVQRATTSPNDSAPSRRDAPREQPRQPEQRTEQRSPPAPATRGPETAPRSNDAPQPSRRGRDSGEDSDREKDRNNDRGRGH